MKRLLLFTIGTFATFQLSAQQQVHLSVSSGIGKIGFRLYPGDRSSIIRYEDRYFSTYNINMSYAYGFGDFSIESGLAYNDLKGYQTDGRNETEMTIDGSYRTVQKDIITERTARYLTVPLKLNYRIDKLQIGAGVYASTSITNRYYAVEYTDGLYTNSNNDGNAMKNFDFGVSAQVEYALSDRASLLFSTNIGLMNLRPFIYQSQPLMPDQSTILTNWREVKNRQFMLGLKFRLFES